MKGSGNSMCFAVRVSGLESWFPSHLIFLSVSILSYQIRKLATDIAVTLLLTILLTVVE